MQPVQFVKIGNVIVEPHTIKVIEKSPYRGELLIELTDGTPLIANYSLKKAMKALTKATTDALLAKRMNK